MKKHILLLLFIITTIVLMACGTTSVSQNPTQEASPTPCEPTSPPAKLAPKIELSGNVADSFITEEDCYAEGEEVILYFQKGLTIRGDMLAIAEITMKNLCETSGLSFDPIHQPSDAMECRDMYYEPGIFSEINKDNKKINILVVKLEGEYVQWASDHNAILDITDFDFEPSHHETIYHELAHVLQARNGVDLGPTMNEGYAVYVTDKYFNEQEDRRWNTVQHFYPASFDESLVTGGENSFQYDYGLETNYNYGFRFVTFLVDTYGVEVYQKILTEATNQNFQSSYRPDYEEADKADNTRMLVSIIKSQTSENVFEKFSEWYQNNWSRLAAEYMAQMENTNNQ